MHFLLGVNEPRMREAASARHLCVRCSLFHPLFLPPSLPPFLPPFLPRYEISRDEARFCALRVLEHWIWVATRGQSCSGNLEIQSTERPVSPRARTTSRVRLFRFRKYFRHFTDFLTRCISLVGAFFDLIFINRDFFINSIRGDGTFFS